jgi:GT2 family glycosyltransferase
MDKKDTVCAVVVTYNRKELLLKCLTALASQTHPLEAIYIIDNASSDGTSAILKENGYLKQNNVLTESSFESECEKYLPVSRGRESRTKIFYFRNRINTGGAGGFYEGVKRGHEKGYDWLWLMDDDVYPEKNALECLYKRLGESDVLVPLAVSEGTSKVIDWSGVSCDLSSPFNKFYKIAVHQVYAYPENIPETLEISDFSFEGPLVSSNIINKAGYPRKDFFIYCDDTEYALRIKKNGGKILLVKGAILLKDLSDPHLPMARWKEYYYKRNMMWIYKTYGENIFVKYLKPVLYSAAVIITQGLFRMDSYKIKITIFALLDAFTDNFVCRTLPCKDVK